MLLLTIFLNILKTFICSFFFLEKYIEYILVIVLWAFVIFISLIFLEFRCHIYFRFNFSILTYFVSVCQLFLCYFSSFLVHLVLYFNFSFFCKFKFSCNIYVLCDFSLISVNKNHF